MTLLRNSLVVAASLAALMTAQAQTRTQSEMNRGVPGVDVDVGRDAKGAVDVNRSGSETSRGVPGVDVDAGRDARGAVDVNVADSPSRRGAANDNAIRGSNPTNGRLPARADRN